MGFGPKPSSVQAGVQAVRDLIELLYPERATAETLGLFEATTRALLTSKASLSFENIDRFWRDVAWRTFVLERLGDDKQGPWDAYREMSVVPETLDENFGWLINDRLNSSLGVEFDTDE